MRCDPIRVLLIEDNPGDARLICEMLAEVRDAEVEVECVDRLSAGLKRLAAGGIDVLLLDLSLPDGQGLDVCVRANTQAPYVPIVVLTGLDDETMAVKTLHMGAQDYLIKGQVDSRLLFRSMRYAIERKRMEEELRKSEEKWRSLVENAPNIIMLTDSDNIIKLMNRTVSGFDVKDVIGMSIYDYIRPEYHDAVREAVDGVSKTGKTGSYEIRGVGPDGSMSWYETWISLVKRDGEVIGVVHIISDITERKRMESEIKESEQRYRELFNGIRDGVMVIGLEGKFRDCNDATLRRLGYSREEFLRLSPADIVAPDFLHHIRSNLGKLRAGEITIMESAHRCKDGTIIPVEANTRRIEYKGGVAFLAVVRDITMRKQLQEQLQHSQLLVSLGEMTAGIAHEVNNPLGSILLYSEMLMQSDVSSQIRKDLKVIHDEAKRAARVMTDLLTYGRRVEHQARRLNVHSVLKKVLGMRQYGERVQNIAVSTNLLDGPLYVRGNSAQLTQVFMNLIMNAEEAFRESNGGNIVITTQIDRERAKVSVADDGSGIPEENLDRVFHPFFTTKQVGEGTGLGLSICYGIVTGHGGLIHAENNEMGGATFTVELPLAEVRRQRSSPRGRKRASLLTT
ncbi:PAS domain S-box protein [Chloroflexota bacterium]